MDARTTIREKLAELVAREPSRAEFARKVGVARPNVNAWLNGDTSPDVDRLCHIASLYAVPISDFFPQTSEVNYELVGLDTSEGEAELLTIFRGLSSDGREYVLQAARVAASSRLFNA